MSGVRLRQKNHWEVKYEASLLVHFSSGKNAPFLKRFWKFTACMRLEAKSDSKRSWINQKNRKFSTFWILHRLRSWDQMTNFFIRRNSDLNECILFTIILPLRYAFNFMHGKSFARYSFSWEILLEANFSHKNCVCEKTIKRPSSLHDWEILCFDYISLCFIQSYLVSSKPSHVSNFT